MTKRPRGGGAGGGAHGLRHLGEPGRLAAVPRMLRRTRLHGGQPAAGAQGRHGHLLHLRRRQHCADAVARQGAAERLQAAVRGHAAVHAAQVPGRSRGGRGGRAEPGFLAPDRLRSPARGGLPDRRAALPRAATARRSGAAGAASHPARHGLLRGVQRLPGPHSGDRSRLRGALRPGALRGGRRTRRAGLEPGRPRSFAGALRAPGDRKGPGLVPRIRLHCLRQGAGPCAEVNALCREVRLQAEDLANAFGVPEGLLPEIAR